MLNYFLADEQATLQAGALLAQAILQPPVIVFLIGSLGAGKTTFARGFLQGLGYTGKVKSPTYTLVEPYQVHEKSICHCDLYRLHDPQELLSIGIQDYFSPQTICLIEWPEHGGKLLPSPDMISYLDIERSGRGLRYVAYSLRGEEILGRLEAHHPPS
ncbi:MAG: tRNA (adenosine(37)-N6)-threonylcarbamoyltransferase complex ATPase subunit type 1 TsaE [Gammaproteobacteria bacterium RIFCSPHIGHO2_12_FULL_41_20]|nr:MAG: tRNA (adenosine(37)-N6)-threonylcarbamoyltransferase complex ATPase subunit type 1 TsaE [Gammaproteobacteria bacterium RIFCSPHIGHO2_12_FULL_41_20]